MTRIVYVNGRYRPYADAFVHAEDRGFQFADAVYEVCEVNAGAIIDLARHLVRLERSLQELQIMMPMRLGALKHVMRETVRRNRVRDGLVYLQVSRGAGPRDFAFPPPETPPTLVCLARAGQPDKVAAQAEIGISVITLPDIRWKRCDIKTVMLLPAVLAKREAARQGAKEAWLVDADGCITEGASSNAWIVTQDGELLTRSLSPALLPGVARATLMDAIAREGLGLRERAFTVDEARAAREAFVTSATNTVMPVVCIDGSDIGPGKPGPLSLKLRNIFHEVANRSEKSRH